MIDQPIREDRSAEELEAIIREARRRTRRRRLRFAAAGALIATLIVGAWLLLAGDDDSDTTLPRGDATAVDSPAGNDLLYMRALVHGELLVVNPQDGTVEHSKLPVGCGDTPHCLIPSGTNLIVSGVGRTVTFGEGKSRNKTNRVGNGWITVPAQEPNAVWLGILAKGENRGRGLSAVREVDLDGNVIRSIRPPDGRWPMESTDEGLLFQIGNGLRLWSFDEKRLTEHIPGPFPADTHGSLVASCGDPCKAMAITDLQSGSTDRIAPPQGFEWASSYQGSFSPDGTKIALPISRGDRSNQSLALVDVATGEASLIPRSGLEPWYQAITWSSDGSRLYWSTADGALKAYDPAEDRTDQVADLQMGHGGRVIQMVAVPSE